MTFVVSAWWTAGRIPADGASESGDEDVVALGGVVKAKVEELGGCMLKLVKPTSKAGLEAFFRDQTCTRSGIDVFESSAIRTELISVRLSRGARSSWYAGRPATLAG
jgi:hypothetical protein